MSYKKKYSFQQRAEESSRVLVKYPDRIPIICEKSSSASYDCPEIDKNKYLVPRDLTMGQFLYVIRKRMSLPPEKGIFLIIGNFIPSSCSNISEIYNIYGDNDGFLYILYSSENVFG
jgi:GABA(A) receptor-associated protein